MEEGAGTFTDWELLNKSAEIGSVNSFYPGENMSGLEGIDVDSGAIIRADYFSPESQNNYTVTGGNTDASEEGSLESDNPSWIDPESETRYLRKEPGESWYDSSSERSDDCKFIALDATTEFDLAENAKSQQDFDGIGKFEAEGKDMGKNLSGSGLMEPISMEFGEFERHKAMEIGENENSSGRVELEDSGLQMDCSEDVAVRVELEDSGLQMDSGEDAAVGAVKTSGEEEKRNIIWWKVPFDFLKYCAFRFSPVWTFSVAAAVLGFVILGRRWRRMKKKSHSLQLKVTTDEKKVSQFMGRVARLNEAFLVVKWVPVIRPLLPATGVTPWPVMSLR